MLLLVTVSDCAVITGVSHQTLSAPRVSGGWKGLPGKGARGPTGPESRVQGASHQTALPRGLSHSPNLALPKGICF